MLNVGISTRQPVDALTAGDWDRVFAVNVRSNMLFAQGALRVMAPGGAILLISSLASQRAASRNPAYETSKAAQVALARSIARVGEPRGIRCNSLAPRFMDTPMGRDASRNRAGRAAQVPFGRQGTGWEVAYAALFLVSNEASYVNGHGPLADGGFGASAIGPLPGGLASPLIGHGALRHADHRHWQVDGLWSEQPSRGSLTG
ncbi:MAG: SDR family oxidoreductase [Roseomonas mucosa]|nr:SDR family oxidoreductase [Roseomonas mucosa]